MDIELNIQNKKLELIQWLSTIEDASLLDKILALRKQEKDWWDTISDDEKASIKRGIADADAGKLIPHSEVRKRYEKWL